MQSISCAQNEESESSVLQSHRVIIAACRSRHVPWPAHKVEEEARVRPRLTRVGHWCQKFSGGERTARSLSRLARKYPPNDTLDKSSNPRVENKYGNFTGKRTDRVLGEQRSDCWWPWLDSRRTATGSEQTRQLLQRTDSIVASITRQKKHVDKLATYPCLSHQTSANRKMVKLV